MEIKKTHRLTTKICGSAPAIGAEAVLKNYITGEIDKGLFTFAQQNLKKSYTIENMITEILSTFHRNGSSEPVLGNWMVRRCMVVTGMRVFDARKDKTHPTKGMIPMAIEMVDPLNIQFYRKGKIIAKPDGVMTMAMTAAKKSFFKAYEYIDAGAEAVCTYFFDDDLVTKEQAEYWIQKSGLVGWGAYRDRYGKFEVL